MPGIVGMHDHLFYIRGEPHSRNHADDPLVVSHMTFSAPRLYLANGVTTLRTTGSVETYSDLNLKKGIDAGNLPGPHLDVTGPYLEGSQSYFLQMPHLTSPEDARQTVEYWADRGVTSFKAYMNITRAELKAAIDAAHKRGIKVTGHLCFVTYKEAAELGIDNLEHRSDVNTAQTIKSPMFAARAQARKLLPAWTRATRGKRLIATLVGHHVAITSTLPVFEGDLGGGRPVLRQQALDAMTPQAREDVFLVRQPRVPPRAPKIDPALLWKHDLELERAFVAAGGLLLGGPDPTGRGDVLPGFGDQREIELLVEAGFSPVEAIKIATLNGAVYLGRDQQIGSIAAGKNADLVVMKGDPSKQISDIEKVEIVFKEAWATTRGSSGRCGDAMDSIEVRVGHEVWRGTTSVGHDRRRPSGLENSPHKMGEQSEYQEHECGNPDQKVGCQLWGLDFFFIHGTRILPSQAAELCPAHCSTPNSPTDPRHPGIDEPKSLRFGAGESGHGSPRSPAVPKVSPFPKPGVFHAVPGPPAADSTHAGFVQVFRPEREKSSSNCSSDCLESLAPVPAIEWLERLALAELQHHPRPRHPVGAFAVNQMADHIEGAPGIFTFISQRPSLRKIAQ